MRTEEEQDSDIIKIDGIDVIHPKAWSGIDDFYKLAELVDKYGWTPRKAVKALGADGITMETVANIRDLNAAQEHWLALWSAEPQDETEINRGVNRGLELVKSVVSM